MLACNVALGLEDNRIKDGQLSSSSPTKNHPATEARLNGRKAWKSDVDNPWIQVHLGQFIYVAGIATQGRADGQQNEWVTEYTVVYMKRSLNWEYVKNAHGNYVSIRRISTAFPSFDLPHLSGGVKFVAIQLFN